MPALLFNVLFATVYAAVGIWSPETMSPFLWACLGFHIGLGSAILMLMIAHRNA